MALLKVFGFSSEENVLAFYDRILPNLKIQTPPTKPGNDIWAFKPLPARTSDTFHQVFLHKLWTVWRHANLLPSTEKDFKKHIESITNNVNTFDGFIFMEFDAKEAMSLYAQTYSLGMVYYGKIRHQLLKKKNLALLTATAGFPLSLNLFGVIAALLYIFGPVDMLEQFKTDAEHTVMFRTVGRLNSEPLNLIVGDRVLTAEELVWLGNDIVGPLSYLFPLALYGEHLNIVAEITPEAESRMYSKFIADNELEAKPIKNWITVQAPAAVLGLLCLRQLVNAVQLQALINCLSDALASADGQNVNADEILLSLCHLLKSKILVMEGCQLVKKGVALDTMTTPRTESWDAEPLSHPLLELCLQGRTSHSTNQITLSKDGRKELVKTHKRLFELHQNI
ncbi:hypothetical protein [Bufonid herpesvirus 1]|uniref:hypothetical protein n=1 Tax=Bufonid herpesvirus 1 TaxID=2282206 RepID=UPI000EB639BF|nr:hypothetical protein [Bufonid herpesvirus 1]AXF48623.1 hypothetical protein [Bufonid herpesvirus 1]